MKRLLLAGLLAGCQTVTINPGGQGKIETTPDYRARKSFFLWGLSPSAQFVNVETICGKQAVQQMRAQQTFVDSVLSIVTLGIYSPRTAMVWCQQRSTTISAKAGEKQ